MDDHSQIKEEFENLPNIAKSVLLKRLNKLQVFGEMDKEALNMLFDEGNEEEAIKYLEELSEDISLEEQQQKHQRYLEAKTNPKRHLDRAHGRRLHVINAAKLVKSIKNIPSITQNYALSYEVILLGLKSKDKSFKKLAEEFIKNNSQIKYLKSIYKELAKLDFDFAQKTYNQNKSKYIISTKTSIEKALEENKN